MDTDTNIDAKNKKIQSLIDASRLLDDNLMTLVFDGNIEATQLVLNIILERKDLIVKTVMVQKLEKSPLYNGRDVKIDVFAEDSDGNRFDIEIQRANEGADGKRARFNSAVLDVRMLRHSQKYKEIKDSYVIFITENDVLKKGRALTHFDRTAREDGDALGDGSHIIYANAAYPDTSSEIGKLMHDFRCRNSEDMYYGPLRDGVHHFKETEGGRARMSKEIEEYGRENEILGAIGILKDMGIPEKEIIEKITKKYNVSEEYVRGLIHTAA